MYALCLAFSQNIDFSKLFYEIPCCLTPQGWAGVGFFGEVQSVW